MDTQAVAIPRISPSELAQRMGRPNAPLVLDVRRAAKFAESPYLLAGAQWCNPDKVVEFAASNPPQEVVVYCVYGHEVGRSTALRLRAAGFKARFLQGGIDGWAASGNAVCAKAEAQRAG